MSRVDNVILLMRDNTNSLGFIPSTRVEEQESKGLIFHQVENGDWVGYLMVGSIKPGRPVFVWQECIDKSARRYGSGFRLFHQLLNQCKICNVTEIILRCAENLESNYFWQTCGFELVKTITTRNARNRKINVYRFVVTQNLFDSPSAVDIKENILLTEHNTDAHTIQPLL